MTKRQMFSLAACVVILIAPFTPLAEAVTLTDGVTLNWDVALDQNNNAFLDSTLNRANNRRWDFPGGAGDLADATVNPLDHAAPGINFAIDLPVSGNGGVMESFNDFGLDSGGNKTTQGATFELIANFSDLVGKHALFETGGNGAGMAFFIDGDQLSFQAQSADNPANRATVTLTQSDVDTLVHLVGTINTTTGTVELFKNGVSAGSATASVSLGDWAGGDDSGLGRISGGANSITGGSGGTFTAFDGSIATLRYYRDKVLTASEVAANHAFARSDEAGSLFQWDAGLDPDGGMDGTFEENNRIANVGGRNLALGGSVTYNGSASSAAHSEITASYVFDGSSGATMGNFETALDNPTNDSASFEIYFKADDLVGQEVLWEVGGSGDGSSLTLDGDTLQFIVKDGSISASVSSLATNDDFIKVLSVIDLERDMIQLLVNDTVVGSAVFTGSDWAGSDGLGLGIRNGTVGGTGGVLGNINNYGGFEGEIGIFRFYSQALTVLPEPSTATLGMIAVAGMLIRRRRAA